jgi:hypothetical protein
MRSLLLTLLASIVVGCSPYSYPKEVSAISAGVNQISDAFTSGYTALASDRAAEERLVLIDNRAQVSLTKGCDDPTNRLSCGIYRFKVITHLG